MRYFISIWIVLQLSICIGPRSVAVDYDPLRVAAPEVEPNRVEPIDLDVNDTNRNRVNPVKVYLPASKAPEPVVLFSHGLGGDREGGAYLKVVSPFGNQTLESRRAVYIALPRGDKYELLLHNAEHSAFGDNRLRGENPSRDPNHHRVILVLSTAFWDTYLRGDEDAKTYLHGPVGKAVSGTLDHLQVK